MLKKCDVYAFHNTNITHNTTDISTYEELEKLEQLTYQVAFKKSRIYLVTSSEEKEDQLVLTKATLILPPVLFQEEKHVILENIEKILTLKKAKSMHFYVLNFLNAHNSLDIEYQKLKSNELDLIKPIIEIYFAEKGGYLNAKEKSILEEFRSFNFEKIILGESKSLGFANHNMGTILVTNDGHIYELPETYGYHEISVTVTLAKHFNDRKYLNYGINQIIAQGNLIVVLNHLQVLVYRAPTLTNIQKKFLKKLKSSVLKLMSKRKEEAKYLITGAFLYTGQDTLGIMEFLEDEKALESLSTNNVIDVINATNELYYTTATEKNTAAKR